ncbi:hypothetical protein Dimus_029048 [Dionaea muscipula]
MPSSIFVVVRGRNQSREVRKSLLTVRNSVVEACFVLAVGRRWWWTRASTVPVLLLSPSPEEKQSVRERWREVRERREMERSEGEEREVVGVVIRVINYRHCPRRFEITVGLILSTDLQDTKAFAILAVATMSSSPSCEETKRKDVREERRSEDKL